MRSAVAFRPEFLDFKRGIRVGNLEENQRITRLLKVALEERYFQPFVTERWGRGVYWRWIGFLVRANREAKPMSSHVSFGCSKFFVMMDTGERLFECGMQIERGYVKAPRDFRSCQLQPDWDWHRLLKALKPDGLLDHEIRRLLREGFRIFGGSWEDNRAEFTSRDFPGVRKVRRALEAAPANHWAGFQLSYGMTERDVKASSGPDLIDSMLTVFDEVTPAMNLCMQIMLPWQQGRGERGA